MRYNLILFTLHQEFICRKNNYFDSETQFLNNWKKNFNPYLFNSFFLQIIYVKQSKNYLDKLCVVSKKDQTYYLQFSSSLNAQSAFKEISQIPLHWNRKLNGLTIEITFTGFTTESRNALQQLIQAFFQQQKIALQAKRHRLLKNKSLDKKAIDTELKNIEKLMVFRFI